MGRIKDATSVRAALRMILGAVAALGLVFFIAQIPSGTITEAAPAASSSATPQADVAPQLSTADAAACGLLQRALLRVARGMDFDRALTNYAFVPWTTGLPSSNMRGVFNAFHRATSLQRNYMQGEATQQEAADSFNSSVAAYAQICEVGA
ncbi:MAG: hypothetical protein Q7L55_05220 [Actinomycetota bacterium]|nr:hypothetical protein [Actinomycetota bacterium]